MRRYGKGKLWGCVMFTMQSAFQSGRADVITDWNIRACQIVVDAKLDAPPANRVVAIIHTAVYEAANAITKRYPTSGLGLEAAPGASVEAAIARFWEATLPPTYYGIVRSVASVPGRDLKQNARLFAAVAQAADDAIIAVFDAKYHYNFWRPITAIRNGEVDGNDATERDPSWTPFIATPMHPEYPCAHCIFSGAIGTVL